MNALIEFSIIICTRDRASSLSMTLDSIAAAIAAAPRYETEVVLVDNGSTDDTQSIITQWSVTAPFSVSLLYEQTPGLSRARNAGIKASRGAVLIFTDDDCTLAPDYLNMLATYYANDAAPAIRGGRVELGDPADIPFTIKTNDTPTIMSDDDFPGGFILGANMVISRSAIDIIGNFDERFGVGALFHAAEDSDLILRAHRAGIAVEYVPDLTVKHYHGRKHIASIARLHHGYHIGNGALYAKHCTDLKLLQHLYWDCRNMFLRNNLYDPELGLTYSARVAATLKGIGLYIKQFLRPQKPTVTPPFIAKLQAQIDKALAPHMPASGRFALVDFPDYANVGDSAIWLGQLAYFRAHPAFVCGLESPDWETLEHIDPDVIFISGGGNFGDLWPKHQNYREQLLQRFPDKKIVQLPQSIHFAAPAAIARAARIINAHADFTLLVRDEASLAFANTHFTCAIKLCPDMAFCLGPITKPIRATQPLLLLLRTDKEKAELGNAAFPEGSITADWVTDDVHMKKFALLYAIFQLPSLGLNIFKKPAQRELRYRILAQARLARGIRQLSSPRFIITDRLHAHILCLLLNQPHIALDNSYGKLSNFMKTWTHASPLTQTAHTLPEAIARFQRPA